MDTILKYLDMSFASLPNTPEIFRLKQEMAAHMEEKYNELKYEGKTENEAIGIVIAEFGSIEEIASEFGLELNSDEATYESRTEVSLSEAQEYINSKEKSSKQNGIGVFIILVGVSIFMAIQAFFSNSELMSSIGVVIMLPFIALAVGIFISAGFKTKSWEYIEHGEFTISPFNANEIKNMQGAYRSKLMFYTVVSVALYILCPAIIIISATIDEYYQLNDFLVLLSISVILLIVGLATLILTFTHGRDSAYNALLKTEDYSQKSKKAESIVGVIASIWWPITTVIYLGLSFLTDIGWGMSWIVWPISGILFGAIAGAVNIFTSREK